VKRVGRIPLGLAAALLAGACGTGGALATRGASTNPPGGTTTSRAISSRSPGQAAPGPAVAATARLALTLLRRLDATGNVVFSPYSIETALAMVDQGAAGETATEIGHVLGQRDAATLAAANGSLAAELRQREPNGPTLEDANALWIQSGFAVERAFTRTLARSFGAAPRAADFSADPAAATAAVNGWVADHTAHLITDLMPPSAITAQTLLVLANAIYLKARWLTPFDAQSTSEERFYPPAGAPVQAPFMAGPDLSVPYGDGPGYRAVELPYRHTNLALLAVMPTAATPARFERSLTAGGLGRIVAGLRSTQLDLRIPRLALSVHADLRPALSALGMPVAFSTGADFTGIAARPPLAIQAVEHAAVLKVDEAGTVAAAATGISIAPTAIAVPVRALTLDHPFLLFLRDRSTGAILFAARVDNPLAG
jgi:serine protease inhibitor